MTKHEASLSPPPAPHLGPVHDDDRKGHDHFGAIELATVLSHYDLGVIRRMREYRRGSRRAPKIRMETERGEFLLKRRAPGRDDPDRVAFTHDLQHRLADHGYPVPALVPTRSRGVSMLCINKRVYEMFMFLHGQRDDRSITAAREAGRALGRLHDLLRDYRPSYRPPPGSYHAAAGLAPAMRKIPAQVIAADPTAAAPHLEKCCTYLLDTYREAARHAGSGGLERWRQSVIHGDWHPGNILYQKGSIVGVLDFDSARIEPRCVDIANAALQFSMTMGDPDDPAAWPDDLEVKRIGALLEGYDEAAASPVSADERKALPWLMIEALILESVVPIAATGRFAQLSGRVFLEMVERKTRWLRPRAGKLGAYLNQ